MSRVNLLAYLAILLVVAGGLYFIDQRDAQRQQDICGLITLLDVPLPSSPVPSPGPVLDRQRKILNAMHAYHEHLDCPAPGR